jgi:hypothetical protein
VDRQSAQEAGAERDVVALAALRLDARQVAAAGIDSSSVTIRSVAISMMTPPA